MAAKAKTRPFEIYATDSASASYNTIEIDLGEYMDLADNQVFAVEDVWIGVDTVETQALTNLAFRAQLTDTDPADFVSHSEPTSIGMVTFDGSTGAMFSHSALEDSPEPRYNVTGKLYLASQRFGSNSASIITRITGKIVTMGVKEYAQLVLETNRLTN